MTAFIATHVVPASGLPTWPSPDPSSPQGPPLAGGLDVHLLETTPQGWARIACSNGWTAWVDAARLTAPLTRKKSMGMAWRTSVVVGGLAVAGAAAVAGATFLPWFSAAGESVSSWDVGLYWIVFGTGDGTGGIRLGLPLVLAAGVVVLLAATRQRVRFPVAVLLAAMASWSATFALSRVLRPAPHPDIGIGPVIAFIGAGFIAADAYQSVRRQGRGQ